MSSNKNYKIFGLVVTAILVIGGFLFLNHKLDNVGAKIIALQNHINTINNNNDLTISYLKADIEEMLKKQNQTFFDEKYTVVGYDKSTNLTEIQISFSLKEVAKNDIVSVKANDITVKAEETTKGSFEATVKINPDKETAISYIVESDTYKSQELFKFTVKNELQNRFKNSIQVQMPSQIRTGETKPAYINVNIANVFNQNEKLKAKDCKLLIYDKSKLIKTVDLMPYIISNGGVEAINIPDFNEREYAENMAGKGNNAVVMEKPLSSITIDVTVDSNVRAECEFTDNLGIVYTFNQYN